MKILCCFHLEFAYHQFDPVVGNDVTGLESEPFQFQKLYFYLDSSLRKMKELEDLKPSEKQQSAAEMMASQRKRIAVVGGGVSGLLSIASLKEEGFETECFEKTDNHGGTWCYRDELIEGVPSIMPSTIANHSKEMGAFSNFPPKKEYSVFMKNRELYQYITDFAKTKDLLKHISYNTEVVAVRKAQDYEDTGRWVVTVKCMNSGETFTGVYDGVMVCIGHINRPKIPMYPGKNLFRGKIMHSCSLKNNAPYVDQTVVVVGMGCSGLDAAVETSNVAKQVYLSTRSGAHVMSRIGYEGYPFDYNFIRPYLYHLSCIVPFRIIKWLFKRTYLDCRFHHKLYPIEPDHEPFSKDLSLNDFIGSKLLSGSIIQKPDIECFTEEGVIFKGDFHVTKADVVIMATGYTWEFPFLERDTIVQEEGRINLYKCMYPLQLQHATLAIIGFFLPNGPAFPIGELQSRWATRMFARKCKLPSKEEMLQEVKRRHSENSLRYTPSEKMSVRVSYVEYSYDLADMIGAKPDVIKLFLTDITLFFKVYFGPVLPYHYRLQGPHAWNGAREAIMTSTNRMLWGLTKGKSKTDHEHWFKVFVTKLKVLLLL
ncbi:dimethylaniline monooxygenase 2 [Nephila pilipes]|uniref:Flavin-containing monooxygenase n=1 Tax=Nephila pilipes TaxID=299642 RepID=A0A8X6NQJ9_NEPPI|nr:dimethylaniline monooxygenase 2 [Nephila pilipes]